jgi:hypothetical protein
MLLPAGSLVAMDDADRKLLEETKELLREAIAMFKEYEPLLKRFRSPTNFWKH